MIVAIPTRTALVHIHSAECISKDDARTAAAKEAWTNPKDITSIEGIKAWVGDKIKIHPCVQTLNPGGRLVNKSAKTRNRAAAKAEVAKVIPIRPAVKAVTRAEALEDSKRRHPAGKKIMKGETAPLLDSPTTTGKAGRIDHSGCPHEATKAGRAACRRNRAQVAAEDAKLDAQMAKAAEVTSRPLKAKTVRGSTRLEEFRVEGPRHAAR